ncbi:MAG TPA: hypothetical protein VG271_04735 [Beijerinckiaceae bacterium]|nr:hypothetical protein [Beijerinckiaceae bacterium]
MVGRLIWIAFAIELLGPIAAHAQDADWPPPVKAAIGERQAYCKGETKPLQLGDGAIRKLDLAGDGHVDYILDDSKVSCAGDYMECGSGGCGVLIFMQTTAGYTKVFDDIGGKISIARHGKGYMVGIPQRDGPVLRLVFAKGCAVDLAHRGTRHCKAAN